MMPPISPATKWRSFQLSLLLRQPGNKMGVPYILGRFRCYIQGIESVNRNMAPRSASVNTFATEADLSRC